MKKELNLVIVNYKYCDYLRNYDNRVPFNFDKKKKRPFIGVLFEINKCLYFAPLTSPKPKHLIMKNTLDFYRLDNGKLGAINFNNMIPVKLNNIEIININKIDDKQYNSLLKEQYRYLIRNQDDVFKLSKRLYTLYVKGRLGEKIIKRCCNFPLLEEKCIEYINSNNNKKSITCKKNKTIV